jgi:hypothetical protein
MANQKPKSEKEIEDKIRQEFVDASETLSRLKHTDAIDMKWISPSIQAYTAYLNYRSQERSLKQIKITALATALLAIGTLILALVTALHA